MMIYYCIAGNGKGHQLKREKIIFDGEMAWLAESDRMGGSEKGICKSLVP